MLFKTRIKVRSYECDAYGHVNNAVYLQYCEYARTLFLESLGFNLKSLKELGILLVLVRVEIDYLKPLFEGDEVEISIDWLKRGRSSSQFEQVLSKDDGRQVVARALVTWVATDLMGTPIPIPEILLNSIKEHYGEIPPLAGEIGK